MLILNSPCTVGSCPSFPKASQYFGGTACSPTAAQLFLHSLPSTDGSGLELSLEQNHVEIPSSQGCFLGTIWEPGRSQKTLLLSYTQFIHQFLHCKNSSSPLLLCTIDNIGTSHSYPGSVVLSMSQITTGVLEKNTFIIWMIPSSILLVQWEKKRIFCVKLLQFNRHACFFVCLPSVFVNTLLNLSSYSYGLIPYLDLKQIPHAPLFALIAKANFPLSTQVQQKLLRVCCRPSKPVFWVWGTLALFIWQLNEEEPRCSCLCLSAELARAEDNRYADAALWARHSLWPRLQHRADEVRKVAKKNTYAVLLLTWEGSLLKIKISKIH